MKIKDTEISIVQGDITELAVDAVVNAATMGLDFEADEAKIRSFCKSALVAAEESKIKSIAFPALGCGTGGFPLLASAKIMAQEVLRHLREEKTSLKEIIFCLFDKEAYEIFNKGVIDYLEYVTQKLQNGPYITVDCIIEVDGGVAVIQRTNPPFGWALPGGFVDYGESLEDAVAREMKEETDLDLVNLKQFHTYSRPDRDPRFHTICTVFTADGKGKPKAGDDAGALKIVKPQDLKNLTFAFDHQQILSDYFSKQF